MKIMTLAWQRYHRRTELLAQHLGATAHFVAYGQRGRLWQAPLRYPLQFIRSVWLLLRERPEAVLVQNPPIFSVLVVYLYALVTGARFAIDSHTGAFVSPRWRWSLRLHRFLSRRAVTTIVHNNDQAVLVREWQCPYCVIAYTPGDDTIGEPYPLNGAFNVVVISSFSEDEPLDVIFAAARSLPDVMFYVTGNPDRARPKLLAQKPDNCQFTGFIPDAQFLGLLQGADAVIDLTTRDHTLLMGGFEAVAAGTPLITSDWPVLRDYFSLGTVHVSNTVEGIRDGVQQMRQHQEELQGEMALLREQLQDTWQHEFQQLRRVLRSDGAS